MRRRSIATGLACALLFAGFVIPGCTRSNPNDPQPGPNEATYTTEETDYRNPPPDQDDSLADDQLDATRLPSFDPQLVDSRQLGGWELNASAAVIGLNCPIIKPDSQSHLLVLHKSYADAVGDVQYLDVLPSANLLDGATKQFDDGLYAALDLACYRGELGFAPAAPEIVESAFAKLPPGSPARPYLAAALHLAGRAPPLAGEEEAKKQKWLSDFDADQAHSKPISFYTWTPELTKVWRFYRFLQREFTDDDAAIVRPMATAFAAKPAQRKQYRAIDGFYERLTNPLICLSLDALQEKHGTIRELATSLGARHRSVAVFPPSTSRHAELFDELFPFGLPEGTDLMRVLVHKIRTGEVNLKPGEKDGWFQYQVYALETLLMPSRGQEQDKLLLSASYKKRLVEAFQALVTKRIETHVRQLYTTDAKTAVPTPARPAELEEVTPRLRIEPCATFYLRTARAYDFLKTFLLATVGPQRLAKLHALRQEGPRELDLAKELDITRARFYGFYFISCEDLGMKPELLPDEPVDPAAAKKTALGWLSNLPNNRDLTCDTRAAAPIYIDYQNNKTRLWGTLGVRLAPLDAGYAASPKVRPAGSSEPWQEVKGVTLVKASYVIPVDEYAEFELPGSSTLSRDELRAVCDQYKTKEAILKVLAARR